MKLEVRGIGSHRTLRAHIVEALEHTVERLGMTPVGAQVGFDDENGQKGGVAVRCLIEIRLPRRPPLDVRHVAESAQLAFDGALARIDRRLGRDRARRRARSRHPKKYYAAKRALAGEELGRTA
jgi:ribosome-associated translation inhibitor RaiA